MINATGVGLAPIDGWLLLRGVKTLSVRMDRQQANAQRIAEYLVSNGFKVNYPGLKSHPQYEVGKKRRKKIRLNTFSRDRELK